MKIKWLGHSCFLMTAEDGTRVLTDPFNEEVGYDLPAVEADVVTVSHGHFDHNYISIVKGDFRVLKSPGEFTVNDIEITGVSTFHDREGGPRRNIANVVFNFEIDGVRICHCGDLGHVPTPEQVRAIGDVHVLMVPVGGTYTIDYKGALEVVKVLNPLVTIPMHYYTHELKFPLEKADNFIEAAGGEKVRVQEIEVAKDNLFKFPSVLILNYK